jgi:hypothetical protein
LAVQRVRLPLWVKSVGGASIVLSGVVAARLIWEQTALTWTAGPQVIGRSLAQGLLSPLILAPLVMLLWLVIIVGEALVGLVRRRRLTGDLWAHLAGILAVAGLLHVSYGTWQWLFAPELAASRHSGSFLVTAAGRGDLRLVRTLVVNGVAADARGSDGQSALQAAALGGHVDVLEFLLAQGVDIDGVDKAGDSALEKAASRGVIASLQFLEARGAHRIRGVPPPGAAPSPSRFGSLRIGTEALGSSGPAVWLLQAGLNAQLRPGTVLRVDGIYGPATAEGVRRFQAAKHLPANGIADQPTWQALLAPPLLVDARLGKIVNQLGSVDDFVHYIERMETRVPGMDLFDHLWQSVRNGEAARYMLIRQEPYMLDMQHFFAAAAEAADASVSRWGHLPVGGGVGRTLLLGLATELVQCAGVAVHSCFAREDLASNRIGADFGRSVVRDLADGRARPVSQQLRQYLAQFDPQAPTGIVATSLPGALHVVREGALALTASVLDVVWPDLF